MSHDVPEEIRKILSAQSQVEPPKVTRFAILPPIGSSGNSEASDKPLESENIINSPKVPIVLTEGSIPEITEDFDRISLVATRRATPLHRGSIAPLNFNDIPNNELLSPASTARDTVIPDDVSEKDYRGDNQHLLESREKDDNYDVRPATEAEVSITVMGLEMARIPDRLPDITGLTSVLDNLSESRLVKIVDACRLYDKESRGYLSEPSILKCIGEVIPSARQAGSPWRKLLDSLAPNGEFIEYDKLAQLIGNSKMNPNQKAASNLTELLTKKTASSLVVQLPERSTSSQEMREKGRAQVMTEIEVLLIQNPEIDIDRLKLATTQNMIEPNEMMLLLEMYGMIDHFKPFLHRLLSCFLTHDNRFHFGAFVGCLDNVKPLIIRSSAPPTLQSAPWMAAPLSSIGSTTTTEQKPQE